MKTGSIMVLIIFGICLSAITLLFDHLMVLPAYRQFQARQFPSTEGTILSSEVIDDQGGEDGTSYRALVTYAYAVDGVRFTADRLRFDDEANCCPDSPQSIVNSHPPGNRVTVYYDLRHPAVALLYPGIRGRNLLHVTFMAPFNLAVLGFWVSFCSQTRRAWRKPVAGGVQILGRQHIRRARLTFSPFATLLLTAALMAFLCAFAISFGSGSYPPMRPLIIAWIIIPITALLAGLYHEIQILRGTYDLVLDDLHQTIELPATHGRKKRRPVSLANVDSVQIEVIEHRDADGNATYTYAPTLHLHGAGPVTERLAKWQDEPKARGFVSWLRTALPRTATNPRGTPPVADPRMLVSQPTPR